MPLEIGRFLAPDAMRRSWSLALDDETGSMLGVIFRLQERVADLDRVELMALRVQAFSGEEAGYWYSRMTHFGSAANRWAAAGMRTMFCGQSGDRSVGRMLERLRAAA